MTFVLSIVIGLLVLSLLVFVHELGHFILAKACKFKVLAFAIGFGKPLFKWTRGETEYRINAIPFGGYVAMAGSETEVDEKGNPVKPKEDIVGAGDASYPIWQRALVAIAGPLANFVFAILALWCAFIYGIERPTFMDSSKIGIVMKNSPADSAGFLAGDSVVAINSEPVVSWEQLELRLAHQLPSYDFTVLRGGEQIGLTLKLERTGARLPKNPTGGLHPARYPPVVGRIMPKSSAERILEEGDTLVAINGTAVNSFDQFAMLMREYNAESGPVSVDIKRRGAAMNVLVIPTYDSTQNRYLIGLEPAKEAMKTVRYGPVAALGPTWSKTWEYTTMIFDVLGKLISGEVSTKQLAGPLNIIPVSGFMAFQGLSNILNFMALISVNLAVLNLLPLVITDGGLLMFLLIEAIRKKPLSEESQAAINKVFLALFIALFLYVTFNDLQRMPDIFRWLK
ncbi:MAG: RIP metalloprotease RseP [Chitinispirillia bacterium]|nr:RIP metalloprotease RseP [Chitinispirillia bacterium]MCL2241765.1 RIP metalloprotease RseP [Chitinispirillia bacterium]